MAHSKIWQSYPPAFLDVFREGAMREVRIPCEDLAHAKRLMGKLYALKGALKKAKTGGPKVIPMTEEDQKLLEEIYPLACRVQLREEHEGGKFALLVRPTDQDPDGFAITSALARGANGTSASDILPPANFLEGLKKTDE